MISYFPVGTNKLLAAIKFYDLLMADMDGTRMKSLIRTVMPLALLSFASAIFWAGPVVAASDAAETRLDVTEEEEGGTRILIEREVTMPIRVTIQPKTVQCQAVLGLSYAQKNTVADVVGTIDNGQCAASSGAYTLTVSTRDESGEIKTQEFTETWQRSDDQTVNFTAAYPIDENVDLIRVRTRRVSCICTETPEP